MTYAPTVTRLVTVVETYPFAARAKKLLTEDQRIDLAAVIAEDPQCGDPRAVFLNCGENTPTFLLALFAKNEKSNLTNAEKNKIKKASKTICKSYGAKK